MAVDLCRGRSRDQVQNGSLPYSYSTVNFIFRFFVVRQKFVVDGSQQNSALSQCGRSAKVKKAKLEIKWHYFSTPHYTDKYPYVRYSYGNIETGLSVLTQTEMASSFLLGKNFHILYNLLL